MANIRLDLAEELQDGLTVSFKAPCDCTAITGIKVYFPLDGVTTSQEFVMKDAHGNDLTGVGNLFSKGAYLQVILNTVDGIAYLQNADTNGYIEATMLKGSDCVNHGDSDRTDLPLAAAFGKHMKESFQAGCDTLVAKCTAYGVTPTSNSPDDIATAIDEIYSAGIRVFTGYSGNISSTIPNYASLTSANFKVIASSLSCSVGTTQAVSGMRGSSTPSVSYNASTGAWYVGGNSCGWNATSICNLSASMGVYGVVVNPDATF